MILRAYTLVCFSSFCPQTGEIHTGLWIFVSTFANIGILYSFVEQPITLNDMQIIICKPQIIFLSLYPSLCFSLTIDCISYPSNTFCRLSSLEEYQHSSLGLWRVCIMTHIMSIFFNRLMKLDLLRIMLHRMPTNVSLMNGTQKLMVAMVTNSMHASITSWFKSCLQLYSQTL